MQTRAAGNSAMYSTEELQVLNDFARQALAMGLQTQDLEVEVGLDYVIVAGRPFKARCILLGGEEQAPRARVDVGIEILFDSDLHQPLRTRAVGVGRSGEEAVLQAVQVIVEGGVPPLLAAIREPPARAHGSGLTTTPDGQRKVFWEAFAGPVQTATKNQNMFRDHLRESPIIKMFGSPIEFGAGPFSWLQITLSRTEDNTSKAHCILNGNQWDAGSASLEGFMWPAAPGVLYFRQFYCIKAKLV